MKILTTSLLLSLSMSVSYAFADTVKITIRIPSHVKAADNVAVTYTAKCADTDYELQISKEKRRIEFTSKRGSPVVSDISATRFGSAFLDQHLYGRFEFRCAMPGLNVYFTGVQLREDAQPKIVAYYVRIYDDGKIYDHDGLRDGTLELINEPVRKKEQ